MINSRTRILWKHSSKKEKLTKETHNKEKKIYHRSKGNRVLFVSSINCLIAYQYRSGINGDRLLTSTRVSTTRAWEQAGSILRINCTNVSPTHFPINHRARSKWSSKIKNSLLEEMKISTNNTSNSREENDGSDETRGRQAVQFGCCHLPPRLPSKLQREN